MPTHFLQEPHERKMTHPTGSTSQPVPFAQHHLLVFARDVWRVLLSHHTAHSLRSCNHSPRANASNRALKDFFVTGTTNDLRPSRWCIERFPSSASHGKLSVALTNGGWTKIDTQTTQQKKLLTCSRNESFEHKWLEPPAGESVELFMKLLFGNVALSKKSKQQQQSRE